MNATGVNRVLAHLSRVTAPPASDRELLDALISRRDPGAFETLLLRHGPMVLSVCRRTLRQMHDAEDAFQATFLVLLRKAANIRKPEAVASWLYKVAFLTAQKVRLMNARRRASETHAATTQRQDRTEPEAALDEELHALPEKYRTPIILCELQGTSRREAASLLKVPEGTLSSRLATARKMLAKRLRQRGWLASFGAPLAAGIPATLATGTVRAAELVLTDQSLSGVVSCGVISLSERIVKTMFMKKLGVIASVLLVLGALGTGAGRLGQAAFAAGPDAVKDPPAENLTTTAQRLAKQLEETRAAYERSKANAEMLRERVAAIEARYRLVLERKELEDRVAGTQTPARFHETVKIESPVQAITSQLFKYRIPVEIGTSEFKDHNRIEIKEVWGTQPEIKIGGCYIVRGKYSMPNSDGGKLYFYETATEAEHASGNNIDLQSCAVHNRDGEFTLFHEMRYRGYFHVQLFAESGGQSSKVADVYFGTGDNVFGKK
jgi:RNA polymerase sigma factor (sigma-70 family)